MHLIHSHPRSAHLTLEVASSGPELPRPLPTGFTDLTASNEALSSATIWILCIYLQTLDKCSLQKCRVMTLQITRVSYAMVTAM